MTVQHQLSLILPWSTVRSRYRIIRKGERKAFDSLRILGDWFQSRVFLILLVGLVLVVSTSVFIELAEDVLEKETHLFDAWVVQSLRNPGNPAIPRGPGWLVHAARDITALGSHAVLTLVTLSATGLLFLQGKPATARLVLIAAFGGVLLNAILKTFIARERPGIPHELYVMTASFPSGHAMLSAIIFLSLGAIAARSVSGRKTKVYVIAISMILAFLVGISRVYLGAHYPTDILAGWTAGLAWALLCWIMASLIQYKKDRNANMRDDTG